VYKIVLSKKAVKDAQKITQAGLKILEILEEYLFQSPPFYKRLVGNLSDFYSRRINIQHRLVCEVFEEKKSVRVLRMWTHYE
jgi:toxin YoeB